MESISRAQAAPPSSSLRPQAAPGTQRAAPPAQSGSSRAPSGSSRAPSGSSQAASTRAGGQSWSPRLWAILIVLCGALFLDALDVSMVGVALPDIRASLGLSTSSLQWVISGYVLGYGGLLLLGGRAADLLGRRRVFLAALALFAVASLFGGLVSSVGLLIAARAIQGAAAAFVAPLSLSLLSAAVPAHQRGKALGIYSGITGLAVLGGPVLGGAVTQGLAWPWVFWLNVPIG
ncbi:MAG: hypothetical protein DLM62_12610, partial [Pseudonocardiales bacterium]